MLLKKLKEIFEDKTISMSTITVNKETQQYVVGLIHKFK